MLAQAETDEVFAGQIGDRQRLVEFNGIRILLDDGPTIVIDCLEYFDKCWEIDRALARLVSA